jgi:hypothetical protein
MIRALALAAGLAIAAAAPAAHAITNMSSAGDIYATLTIGSLVNGTIGPFTSASGFSTGAQPFYASSDTLASAMGQLGTTGPLATGMSVSTGLLSSSASGGPVTTTASSTIDDLALSVKLAGAPLITLGGPSNVITSTSTATYVPGGMDTLVGSSSLTDLTLDVLGDHINLSAYAHAPPNTVVPIAGIVGLVITVNKQVETISGGEESILTDALDIDFNDLHLVGLPLSSIVSGDIVLGQSFAEVPEPAAWMGMLFGFGMMGGLMRRRRGFLAAA